MKRLLALPALIAVLTAAAIAASSDRTVQNRRGDVRYEYHTDGTAHQLAANATAVLADDDVVRTGLSSIAEVTMPDSSRVIMGSETVLKLDAFSPGDVNAAHFVLFIGKMRFKVEHPRGAKADYTFTTPTSTIAVRGTYGDIAADPLDGVRMNVYGSGGVPVHVTMIDGSQYDVPQGQKIWMRWESGKLVARVTPITQAEIDRFSELGPP